MYSAHNYSIIVHISDEAVYDDIISEHNGKFWALYNIRTFILYRPKDNISFPLYLEPCYVNW